MGNVYFIGFEIGGCSANFVVAGICANMVPNSYDMRIGTRNRYT